MCSGGLSKVPSQIMGSNPFSRDENLQELINVQEKLVIFVGLKKGKHFNILLQPLGSIFWHELCCKILAFEEQCRIILN